MRVVELGRIMAQAEALRLRRQAHRTVNRAIFGAVAAVFGIALLVALHVAAQQALATLVGPVYATLIVAAVDLVVAGVCGYLAASSKPDQIEREALQVRREARAQLGEAMVMSALVLPAMRRAGFGLASRLLGGSRNRKRVK